MEIWALMLETINELVKEILTNFGIPQRRVQSATFFLSDNKQYFWSIRKWSGWVTIHNDLPIYIIKNQRVTTAAL